MSQGSIKWKEEKGGNNKGWEGEIKEEARGIGRADLYCRGVISRAEEDEKLADRDKGFSNNLMASVLSKIAATYTITIAHSYGKPYISSVHLF